VKPVTQKIRGRLNNFRHITLYIILLWQTPQSNDDAPPLYGFL